MATIPESLHIRILGTESGHTLLEFSRLLYHLDLVYEISRLAIDNKYRKYTFPEHTFRRFVSPLEPNDQMILSRVRHESPWELSVLLHDPMALLTGGLGALWLFVQCLEKLSTLGLNRRKVKVEIEKLQLEAEKMRLENLALEAEKITREPRGVAGREQAFRGYVRNSSDIGRPDDSASLIPPKESMRLYRRLKRRGAARFYESNTNAILRLGFEVKDFDLGTDNEE